ncbi:hypothetical protein RI054_18g82500 [Pseudoscourfieldia marina]
MLAVKAETFCVSAEPPLMLVFLSDAASLAELENCPNMMLADLQRLRAACIDLPAAAIAWEPFKTTAAAEEKCGEASLTVPLPYSSRESS